MCSYEALRIAMRRAIWYLNYRQILLSFSKLHAEGYKKRSKNEGLMYGKKTPLKRKAEGGSCSLWTSYPPNWKRDRFALLVPENLDDYKDELKKERERIERELREGDVPLTEEHLSKIVV